MLVFCYGVIAHELPNVAALGCSLKNIFFQQLSLKIVDVLILDIKSDRSVFLEELSFVMLSCIVCKIFFKKVYSQANLNSKFSPPENV